MCKIALCKEISLYEKSVNANTNTGNEKTGGCTMNRYLPIRQVYAREVLDSRGNPTVETEVTVGEGIVGKDGYTGKSLSLIHI